MSNGGSGKAVVVAELLVETRSKWVMVVEVYEGLYTVSELKSRSLSSRNTLGDTSHNSNKLEQNWVKFGWLCIMGNGYAEVVVVVDEEAMVPK